MRAMIFLLTFITDAILRRDQCVEPSGGAGRGRSSTLACNWGVSFCGGWPGWIVTNPTHHPSHRAASNGISSKEKFRAFPECQDSPRLHPATAQSAYTEPR